MLDCLIVCDYLLKCLNKTAYFCRILLKSTNVLARFERNSINGKVINWLKSYINPI